MIRVGGLFTGGNTFNNGSGFIDRVIVCSWDYNGPGGIFTDSSLNKAGKVYNASRKTVGNTDTWTYSVLSSLKISEDTSVATVSKTGRLTARVTGVKAGTADITVTTTDGHSAVCRVTVKDDGKKEYTYPAQVSADKVTMDNRDKIKCTVTTETWLSAEDLVLHIEPMDPVSEIAMTVKLAGYTSISIINRSFYNIYLTYKNEPVSGIQFRCDITLPVPAGWNTGGNTIMVATEGSDGMIQLIPCTISSVAGVLCGTFSTDHFSDYALLNTRTAPTPTPTPTPTPVPTSSSSSSSSSSLSSSSSSTSDLLRSTTVKQTPAPANSSGNDGDRKLDNIPKTGDR